MPKNNNSVTGWVGWAYFAGVLMVLTGAFQAVVGLMALLKSNFYVITPERLAVFNFTTWGWIHLAIAAVVLSAGISVLNGGIWGRVVGVFLAGLGLLANFVYLEVYPFWAITLMVVNALVLYALLVHGDEVRNV